jgi:transposase
MKPKKKDIIKKVKPSYKDNPNYISLKNNILQYQHTVYNPDFKKSNIKNKLNINSCFNIDIYNDNLNSNIPNLNENLFLEKDIKNMTISEKITLNLNFEQKHILKMWFKSNDIMYNETIKYLKNNYKLMKDEFNNNNFIQYFIIFTDKTLKEISSLKKEINKNKKSLKKFENLDIEIYKSELLKVLKINVIHELNVYSKNKQINNEKKSINEYFKNKPYTLAFNEFKLNYQNIRTYFLKNIRDEIIKNCNSNIIDKDIKIKTHILDATIKLACANYQSSITNFENGNIKHFRVRYWKDKRDKRVLEIEKCYFTQGSLCPKIFNELKGYIIKRGKKELYDFKNINSTVKLQYNKKIGEYTIFLSKDIECLENKNDNKKNLISIDLGLRTFATCLSENQTIDICKTDDTKLKKLINKRLEYKNILKNYNTKKNNKKLRMVNKRIKGLVDEVHWKTIKFLTSNYKNILIGELSTKGIVCNNKSILKSYNKELAYAYSFYTFRQRLEYKCIVNKCNYKGVNEYYTSKTCSACSEYNENLGSNKVFNCPSCKNVFDRDVNSCRNMILKCV